MSIFTLIFVFCLSSAIAQETNSVLSESKHGQGGVENSPYNSNALSEFQSLRLEQMQNFAELTLSAAKNQTIPDALLKKMMQTNERMQDVVKQTPELAQKSGSAPLYVNAESLKSTFKKNPHRALIDLYGEMIPTDPIPGDPRPIGVELSPAEKKWLSQIRSNIASKVADTPGILVNSKQIRQSTPGQP